MSVVTPVTPAQVADQTTDLILLCRVVAGARASTNARSNMASTDEAHPETFPPGTEVEVLSRFESRWVSGFEIEAGASDQYTLRRRSDECVLPVAFGAQQIRLKR
jgi:hypothetical protein